ncbi:uncharacterized protein C1orf21 homolog [Arapaima gigas]
MSFVQLSSTRPVHSGSRSADVSRLCAPLLWSSTAPRSRPSLHPPASQSVSQSVRPSVRPPADPRSETRVSVRCSGEGCGSEAMGCTSAKQVSAVPSDEEGRGKAYSNGDLLTDEYKMKAVEEVKYMRAGDEDRVNARNQENLPKFH